MNETQHQRFRDDLVDLAHNELPLWRTMQLRWHLRRCPACQAEWRSLQRLWGSLRRLSPSGAARKVSTISWGGFRMDQRLFVSTYVLALFTIAAMIGGRGWLHPAPPQQKTTMSFQAGPLMHPEWNVMEGGIGMGAHDARGPYGAWYICGSFRGKVEFYNGDGEPETSQPFRGLDPNGEIHIYLHRSSKSDKRTRVITDTPADFCVTVRGYGRFPIRDKENRLLAWIVLKPWSAEEQKQDAQEDQKRSEATLDFLRSPERLSTYGMTTTEQDFGVVTGRAPEVGVSWKLFGYAKVRATYPMVKGKVHNLRSYPYRNIRESDEAKARLEKQLATAPESVQKLYRERRDVSDRYLKERNSLMPDPNLPPVIYWAVAGGERVAGTGQLSNNATQPEPKLPQMIPAVGGYLLNPQGRWPQVKQSGKLSGYGHHEVKDENGKTILVLDVSPLTPGKEAR